MQKILQGIDYFQRHVFPKKRALFERLSSGQAPQALFVGCADSRVALDLVTQTGPGDLFVCRNAGNIIPAHGSGESDSVSASIEYAVCALGVRDIVVCGHSDCGAMKALLHPETIEHLPHVKNWLRHAESARRAAQKHHETGNGNGNGNGNGTDLLAALTKINVRLQLDHLRTHPYIYSQLQNEELNLHAWVYNIGSGEVEAWDAKANSWGPLSATLGPQSAASVTEAQNA